jgi:predicted transcriptional regulator
VLAPEGAATGDGDAVSNRDDRRTRALALRAEGLLQREIAAEMGISRSYVAELLVRPKRISAQEQSERYGKPCRKCGRMTSGSLGRARAPEICQPCLNIERLQEAERMHPCGTRQAYDRGCRCPKCREGNAEAVREYMLRTGRTKRRYSVPYRARKNEA